MHLASLILGSLVGVAALLAARAIGGRGSASRTVRSLRDNAPWLLLLAATTLAEWAFNRLPRGPSPLLLHQGEPLAIETLRAVQGAFPHDLAVPLFSVAYLALFPILLIAVPLALMATGRTVQLRTYCLALALSYAALMTAHLLVQSPRPGLTPGSGVPALLYGDPFWGQLSVDIGSRGNSFPSGHTATLTAMFIALASLRPARVALLAVLALTVASVLFLGLHWPLDVAFGLVLGIAAGLAARALVSGRDRLWTRDRGPLP